MAAAMTARSSWPYRSADGYYPDDDRAQPDQAPPDQVLPDQGAAREVVGEMAALLRNTRGSMIADGMVLSATTIGIALEAAFSARVVRPDLVGAVNVGLLCGLLLCWLRAVTLLALAGRPVLNALSEMRWRTGAPLDSRPRWLTLPPEASPEEWTWMRAHLLLGAARLARYRIQLADTWTYVTAGYFVVWTAIVFLRLLGGPRRSSDRHVSPRVCQPAPDGPSLEAMSASTRLPPYEASEGDTNMHDNIPAHGFWGLLTGNEQAVLSKLGSRRDFKPGATMCHEGDPATYLYVLLTGWVKILSVTSDGQERVLALRGNGDIVGEMAGEATGRRTATLQAIDLVRALLVDHDRFSSFLDSNPGAARAYRRTMTLRLIDTATMLGRHPVTNGAQRLATLLLELAGRHGSEADGAIEVTMPLSQEELASLAGTSRATVARAFRDWRRRGFVRTGQRRITITDLAGLRQVTGQPA